MTAISARPQPEQGYPLSIVGRRIPKLDAPEKVTGRTLYADDLRLPGLLWGAILRSPLPHARIRHVDTSAAERLPGVKAVIHAGNVEQRPFGFDRDNLPLKSDTVRCVGDEVAAVAATDEATAREALSLIQVDYEELPAVFDPFAALDEGSPVIHAERVDIAGNVAMRWDFDHGDVDAAIRRADVVVEGDYSSPLAAPAPIETHVLIASFDASGHLTVWSPVHMVFMYRKELAETLGLDWRKITIRQPPVGGSFGGKIDIDTHDFICVMLARAAGRPVKLAMSREEEFTGTRTRQPIHIHLRTGADAERQPAVPRGRHRLGQRRVQRLGLPRHARGDADHHLDVPRSQRTSSLRGGVHEQGVRRIGPRLRQPAGDLRRGAADGRARRCPRHRSDGPSPASRAS